MLSLGLLSNIAAINEIKRNKKLKITPTTYHTETVKKTSTIDRWPVSIRLGHKQLKKKIPIKNL